METPEALQPCVRREQQMIARLRLAMTRLADAEPARIWALVAAQKAGLSIRQSVRATGVNLTRMHQVLQAEEARAIPVWLSQLQDQRLAPAVPPEGVPPAPSSPGWSHLADTERAHQTFCAVATQPPIRCRAQSPACRIHCVR
jgi:hypothetical protein